MNTITADQLLSATLEQLQSLLRQVAAGHIPNREQAVQYMQAREALMSSSANYALPGFIVQCVSISMFKNFIELYHFNEEARQALIVFELKACSKLLGRRYSTNWLGDDF